MRDRDGLYAEGANKGAPQAKQVADRFHLIQNLRKTIETELAGIRAPTSLVGKPPTVATESAGNNSARTRMAGRDMRELMFNRVRSLHEAGESAEAIRLATGLGHRTVRKWIRLKALPPRPRSRPHRRRSRRISAGDGPRDAPMFLLFWRKFANLASQAVSHDCLPFSPRGDERMLVRQHPHHGRRQGTHLVRHPAFPSSRSCRVIRPPAA